MPLASRLLRLSVQDDRVWITGEGADEVLPPIPASRLDWLGECAARLRRDRGRCLAALLLVHPPTGRWTIRLPRQRCGASGVSWSVGADDFHDLDPSWRLGGTFQAASASETAASGDGPGLVHLVPATDGLHFVLVHTSSGADLRAFIRAGGVRQSATREAVVLNDWAVAVKDAMPRLTLA